MSNVSSSFVRAVLDGNATPKVRATLSDDPHAVMRYLSRPPSGGGFICLDPYDINHLPEYTRNEPHMYSYVIGVSICGHLFYKVGVTQSARKRVKHILSGFPPAFTELKSASIGIHNIATAPNVEQEVLAAFSDRWAGGEWISESRVEASDG